MKVALSSPEEVKPRTTRKSTTGSCRLAPEVLESRDTPASVGLLDPSFGTAASNFELNEGWIADTTLDEEGRVVFVGSVTTGLYTGSAWLVVRLLPDGSRDNSLGGNGRQLIELGTTSEYLTGVAIQQDGGILVTGTVGTDHLSLVVARLRGSDGSFDPTFGNNGDGRIVIEPPPGYTDFNPERFAVDGEGRPVVLARALTSSTGGGSVFVVLRYNADGSALDTTFAGGMVALSTGSPDAYPYGGLTIDDAGRIVVGFTTLNEFGTNEFESTAGVTRLLSNGTLDPTFNGGAVKIIDRGAADDDTVNDIATDADNNIILAGSRYASGGATLLAVRVLEDGSGLDPSFGSGGTLTLDPGGSGTTTYSQVAIQPDGRVVLAASTQANGSDYDFTVVRLLPDGTQDPTFAATGPTPGSITFDFGTNGTDQVVGLTLTRTGRIVVAGFDQEKRHAEVVRLIGAIEKANHVAVSGAPTGQARVYTPDRDLGRLDPHPSPPVTAIPGYTGEVRAVVGDFNGDGFDDTAVVTGPGTPMRVAVVSGADGSLLVPAFDPFGDGFTGGGFVSAGTSTTTAGPNWWSPPTSAAGRG